MFYLTKNAKGKGSKGPWGDKPPKAREDVEDIEKGEAVELFKFDLDLDEERCLSLEQMDSDCAMFELFLTDEGMQIGVLIKLNDEDFATFALQNEPTKGSDIGIFGGFTPNEDGTIIIPEIAIMLGPLGDKEFLVPIFIAESADNGELGQLMSAVKRGSLEIGVGSEKRLFEEKFYIDDEEINELLYEIIVPAIELYNENPWTNDMEFTVYEESFINEDEEEEDDDEDDEDE